MQTLLLDQTRWDLVKDAAGNIAVASPPYATAQDVASACRLFQGELWFDTALGIPYFEDVLGQQVPLEALKSFLQKAALRVPDVVAARAVISGVVDRQVQGQVQVTTSSGTVLPVDIGA